MSRFNEHGLTPQQELFAQQVVAGKTQADAYRAAYKAQGMSEKTIHEESSRVSANCKVTARIRGLQAASADVAILQGADVLKEVRRLAFSSVKGFFKDDGSVRMPHELDDATAACVASFETTEVGVKYKLYDKNTALEKAMKHLGLYEKDNDQQANPLRELLDSLGGAVIGVSSGKSRKK
jgi:phage terminase small subunit